MWSATIKSVDTREGRARLILAFTNGTETFTEEFFVGALNYDLEQLKAHLKQRIDTITSVYSFASSLPLNAPIDPTPKPTDPTVTARDAFLVDYRALQAMQKSIEAGLKKDTDKDYTDLTASVKADFKDEYVPFL